MLAEACARAGIRLLTFSSDQVFDGRQARPWVESDAPAPLNVYGASKAAAEVDVLARCAQALIVRTSAFFGPWDRHNFVVQALAALGRGEPFRAASDVRVSPTYVPDLVNVCLDLLIDGESGLWHLANRGDVSWADLAALAAEQAGVATTTLQACAGPLPGEIAARPRNGVLGSERSTLLPSLEDALRRFLEERAAKAPVRPEAAPAFRAAQRAAGG